MEDLQTTYLGLKLRNPLIAGSCGLTNSIAHLKTLASKGIGAVVLKSLFEEQINVETEKVIKNEQGEIKVLTRATDTLFSRRIHDYDEAYSYIYDFAKRNTVDKYLDFLREAKKTVEVPLIASINCVSGIDWHEFARKIQSTGVDALELNIYVLPSDWKRNGEENEKIYFDIIKEVKSYVDLPVAVKIGYYFSSLTRSVINLSETGIEGLVLFNRPYSPDFDIDKLEICQGPVLSTAEEYNHTLRWVSILSGQLKCDISATTGVHDYSAFIKQLLAGATTVQIASALYREGFDVITDILLKTEQWMRKHKFENIDSFRGVLSRSNLENPAAIERVQFMKYYSGID
ncbi:MAG: dihydroorotate dehydrogenase-like protein [Bacteroidales bacterium]